MSDKRQQPPDHASGQPGPADRQTPPAADPQAGAGQRQQPPLQEVLKGLDARELESTSMFDQLFGPLSEGDPHQPGRDGKR